MTLWSDTTPEHVAIDMTDPSGALFNLYEDIRCLKEQLKTERAAVCTMIEESNQQQTQLVELREALRNILKIADHPPQDIAIGVVARAALLKQGGE